MLTWAEVDLTAISNNLHQIKSIAEKKGASIMAVVKDNAYGHGAAEVARIAAEIPVSMLGVATVTEAIELRQSGFVLPVLVLGCILPDQAEEVVKNDITQTICEHSTCIELSETAAKLNRCAKVHVKVDTGMCRIGVHYDRAVELIKSIMPLENLRIDGLFTHFASADNDESFTRLQTGRFRSVIMALRESNIHIPIKHAANSAAILNHPESYFDMVRPGLAIYGIYPCAKKSIQLQPALTLKTRVVYIKELPSGCSVSYGRTYTAGKTTTVATLPIGYGHGYNRKLSNNADVLIKGIRAPIIGTICMDQCLCDVTNLPDVSVGDEVVIIGKQGNEEIKADELAQKIRTIPYEVLCGINANVSRIYPNFLTGSLPFCS